MNQLFDGKIGIRKDAIEKAAGKARFLDDLTLPGMLHGAVVRSPAPRADLTRLDLARALSVKGVQAAAAASAIPGKNRIPLVQHDYPFLAEKELRFHGQAIALVAADSSAVARRAASRVTLAIKERDPVACLSDSRERRLPPVHAKDNVLARYKVRKGDATAALKTAAFRVSGVFDTPHQMHGYLETQAALAVPEPSGGMTIYGSMQCPFYVRDAVCAILGLPAARVRVIQTTTGGAFGGKEDVPSIVAGHAALMAHLTGKPVKFVYDREEDFRSMSRRHPSQVKLEMGCDKKGKLVAVRSKVWLDGGAYVTLSPIVLWRCSIHAAGAYAVPNVHVDAYAMATNTAPAGAFRGFGQPQVTFAVESLVDDLAREAGLDPVTFRQRNALRSGSHTATGQRLHEKVGLRPALDLAVKKLGRKVPGKGSQGKGRTLKGCGVSCTYYGVGLGAAGNALARAGAFVQVMADGSVQVAVGNTEMGQGARTALSLIAAKALNAPPDRVDMVETDTSRVPDSGPTVASRTTVVSGNAILDACTPLKKSLDKAAAELLGCPLRDLDFEPGRVRRKRTKKTVPFDAVAAQAHAMREHMASQGWYKVEGVTYDPKTGQGDPYATYTYSAHAAEVEVDRDTGQVRVVAIHSAHDIGTVINPREAEGQVYGGILQGMGLAVSERLSLKGGIIENAGLGGYVMPGAADVPAMSASFVDGKYVGGPFGARGLGEPALIGVPAAVANAVADAVGVRPHSLPVTPEEILEELDA